MLLIASFLRGVWKETCGRCVSLEREGACDYYFYLSLLRYMFWYIQHTCKVSLTTSIYVLNYVKAKLKYI